MQEWTCLPSIRRGLFKNSIIPTIYSCLSLFVARSPLPPLFPRPLSATSVIIVRTNATRRGAMTIYLSRPKMLKLCTRPTLQCDGGERRTWSFEALSNLWGPMDSLPPPMTWTPTKKTRSPTFTCVIFFKKITPSPYRDVSSTKQRTRWRHYPAFVSMLWLAPCNCIPPATLMEFPTTPSLTRMGWMLKDMLRYYGQSLPCPIFPSHKHSVTQQSIRFQNMFNR